MSNLTDRKIATKPTATVEQAIAWAKKKGADQLLIDLAPAFWEVCTNKGINPVFSFCQTAYETAYMSFNGCLLDKSFRNTAGIKKSDTEIKKIMMKKYPDHNSSDTVAECHQTFSTWINSIYAQVDHSALYAGLSGYPKKYPAETIDPRHYDWCFGIGKTVLEWAPNYSTHAYGERLLEMMSELESTSVSDNSTCNVTLPILRKGMFQDHVHSINVAIAQTLLKEWDFDIGTSGIDGSFGPATEKAVKQFQRKHGISPDGIIGAKTWKALLQSI